VCAPPEAASTPYTLYENPTDCVIVDKLQTRRYGVHTHPMEATMTTTHTTTITLPADHAAAVLDWIEEGVAGACTDRDQRAKLDAAADAIRKA
jgi:hypothetical protein